MVNFSPEDIIAHTRRRILGWDQAELELERILKGGSDRTYYRAQATGNSRGPKTVIVMEYSDRRPDNKSFFAATEVLRNHQIRCPRVFFHDSDHRLAWVEDLGRRDLWECQDSPPEERIALYQDALLQLGRMHVLQLDDISPALQSHLQPGFDADLYKWEQDYFFDNFARNFSALPAEEIQRVRNQPEFAEMRESLAAMPRFLVHRDFQSQNIIVRDNKTWFIDYQGLRPGRPEYDLASILYDPYVKFSEDEREDLAAYYFENRPGHDRWDTNPEIYAQCCCQRLMQALGAYGYLGLQSEKTAFLRHIPAAMENLRSVLATNDILPGLSDVLVLKDSAGIPAGS